MANEEVVPAVPPMTEKDVKKLEEVTKNRFKLLAMQLKNRKKDLYDAVEAKLQEVHQDAIEKAKAAQAELVAEFEKIEVLTKKINDKGIDLARQLEKDGIRVAGRNYHGNRSGQRYEYQNPYIYQRVIKPVPDEDWLPADYGDKLKEARAHIDKVIRDAEEKLEIQKLEIMERLAIGVLQTDDAKKYVEQIPEIMDLVPDNVVEQLQLTK